MTFGEMATLTDRLSDIMTAPQRIRNNRLATLMTDLEVAYGIPMMADSPRMERVNKFALRMYRTVSDARTF